MVLIEPDLWHLNDEIQSLSREVNVIALQHGMIDVKDAFIRLDHGVRDILAG